MEKQENIKNQFLINCLLSVANSDNDISNLEKEFIKKTGELLGLKPVAYKKTPDPELSSFEKAYFLREMYRIAYVDSILKQSEIETIQAFVKKYNINSQVDSATKKWAETIQKAEIEYSNALADYIN